jgi:hypothetical protein
MIFALGFGAGVSVTIGLTMLLLFFVPREDYQYDQPHDID